MSTDTEAGQLATQIRALAAEIDERVEKLVKLGYNNAGVRRNDANRKLEFTASKTQEFKL